MAFTQVTVTGTYTLADGSPAAGFVRFTPRAPMHNESVVVSAPVVATLDVAGAFSVSLAATDDAGTLTADGATATYRVELVLAGQPARSYQIVLTYADVTRNLADIISVTPTLTAADWLTQTQADALYTSFDSALDDFADLTPANDDVLQRKAGTWANRTVAQLAADLTVSAVQPKDADLTTIAGLTATSDNFLQAKSSAWASRTPTQVAADLLTPLSASLQPLDSDLTAIAALTPTNDDVVQRKAGAWTNRTMAQVKTDLALTKTDVGLANVTNNAQVTGVTAADSTITVGGTSTAPTVAVNTTTAAELIRDTIGTALVAGSNVTITPNDGADTITIASTGGGGGATTVTQQFNPAAGAFRTTAFPALVQANGTTIPVRGLAFDAATLEAVFFRFRAVSYGSGNLTVTLDWYADTASTLAVVWGAAIAALTPTTDSQDTETDALATAATTTTTHAGTTGQRLHRTSITVSSLDSLAADDHVVLQVYRDAANGSDTMTGDAILVAAAVSYSTT